MEPASTVLDLSLWLTSAAIGVLLFLSAFFSGSETALTAASRAKLKARADRGDRGAAVALRVTQDAERFIGAILLGNNLVNILATSLATALFTRLFGESGVALATLVMTALVLIFAEVLPKTYAISAPEPTAARVAPIIRVVVALFAPVVRLVQLIVRGVLALFGIRIDPRANVLSIREEIAGALQLGHSEGIVEKEDRDRILGALDLRERTVGEIMRHRSEIEMIDAASAPLEIVEQVLESPHTRLPVYRDDPDNIIGIIHAKELLRTVYRHLRDNPAAATALEDFDIEQVVMPPYFVPETTNLHDQMRQFLRRHTHFALVVDEYGTLQGLITLEDILEEIVGEITDEFDPGEHPIVRTDEGDLIVDGQMTIRDLNRACDWNLPDEEANTVAGLVIHEAQTIPAVGQVFSFHGFRFEVLEKDGHRISRLKIRPLRSGGAKGPQGAGGPDNR